MIFFPHQQYNEHPNYIFKNHSVFILNNKSHINCAVCDSHLKMGPKMCKSKAPWK